MRQTESHCGTRERLGPPGPQFPLPLFIKLDRGPPPSPSALASWLGKGSFPVRPRHTPARGGQAGWPCGMGVCVWGGVHPAAHTLPYSFPFPPSSAPSALWCHLSHLPGISQCFRRAFCKITETIIILMKSIKCIEFSRNCVLLPENGHFNVVNTYLKCYLQNRGIYYLIVYV